MPSLLRFDVKPAIAGLLALMGLATAPALATVAAVGESQTVAAILARQLPAYRLAQKSDYHPALTAAYHGKAFIKADFNQDQRMDYAVLVVSPEQREYRIYYLINLVSGFRTDLLLTKKWQDNSVSGFIRTPIFFKPAGDGGIADRSYNGLSKAHELPAKWPLVERKATIARRTAFYRSVPAIEAFVGASDDDDELTLMAYRSKTWFYQQGGLKSFEAWD